MRSPCAGCCHPGPHLPTEREHTAYKAGPQCRVPFCLCRAEQPIGEPGVPPCMVSIHRNTKECGLPRGHEGDHANRSTARGWEFDRTSDSGPQSAPDA